MVLEADKLLEYTKNKQRIIVYNKIDIVEERKEDRIYISAKNHDIKPLEEEISKMFSLDKLNALTPSLSSSREIGLLNKAKEGLITAKEEALMGISLDLISVNVKMAYDSIKSILGEEIKTDLSEEIFSRFCVGK